MARKVGGSGRLRFALVLLGFVLTASVVVLRRTYGIAGARELQAMETKRSGLVAERRRLESEIEAQAYAEKALKSFRASEISRTKALFWAANAYYDRAKSDAKEVGTLNENIAGMLGASQKQRRRRKS